jgi:hypothetical protein
MEIRIRESGQVMFWSEFRQLLLSQNPSELITVAEQGQEWCDAHGADIVLEGPQAQPTRYQVAFRDGVQEIDGQWYTKYSVADMSDEAKTSTDEQQAKNIRNQRDQLLKETDWTQLADSPVDKTVWATYRQALRDLPKETSFPWDMTWPTQP